MLDIKLLRKDPEGCEARLKTKDPSISLRSILALDEEVREVIGRLEQCQAERNALSKEIGEKKRKGQDVTALMNQVGGLGEEISSLTERKGKLEEKVVAELASYPNFPDPEAKISADPKDNVCIKTFGHKREFRFPFKNHLELNEKLHLFDFKRGAKTSGSGFVAYRHLGARLEWALLNYMLDIHLESGFEMWLPPHLVRPEVMFGVGQLPKFENQLFKIRDDDYHLYLIPTAEAVLTGLHQDEIFQEAELPKKYVSYTPCFRREAGAAGKDERGLIRMHQFNKVEMFAFATPSQSEAIFQQMIDNAERILQGLNLHYKNMFLVTGDMSFAAKKTVDIEVWLPGQNRYYEVSSVSHCSDFQARRAQIRYRHKEEKPEPVHTLNGSGLATSRLMVALLENNQREDGSIEIPLVLHKYLNGMREICPTS